MFLPFIRFIFMWIRWFGLAAFIIMLCFVIWLNLHWAYLFIPAIIGGVSHYIFLVCEELMDSY